MSFAADHDALYWSSDDDAKRGIYVKQFATGTVSRLVPLKGWADTIVVADRHVLYVTLGELNSVSTRGGSPQKIFAHHDGDGAWSEALIAEGTDVYWAFDKRLFTTHPDGSGTRQLSDGFSIVRGLAVDATHVYVADTGDGRSGSLAKVDRNSGAKTVLLPELVPRPWAVAVDAERIYVINNGSNGVVFTLPKAGGSVSDAVKGVHDGTGIALTNGTLFWTAATPGGVYVGRPER